MRDVTNLEKIVIFIIGVSSLSTIAYGMIVMVIRILN